MERELTWLRLSHARLPAGTRLPGSLVPFVCQLTSAPGFCTMRGSGLP